MEAQAVVVAAAAVVVAAAVVLALVVHPEPALVRHQVGKLGKSADVETRIGDKICGRCDCRATSWLWAPTSPPGR